MNQPDMDKVVRGVVAQLGAEAAELRLELAAQRAVNEALTAEAGEKPAPAQQDPA